MPTLLQLSQSYQNPESVNYRLAYLREQMEQQLLNLGDLAYEDQVQLAMLGETIIVGGYLRTELIAAKSIRAEKLDVEDLAAISGKFTGDVYVGGDLLVGGQGVLSMLKYESMGQGPYFDTDGWSPVGIMPGPRILRGRASLLVNVPPNFSITRATLTLYAMPTFYYNPDYPSFPMGHETKWKQSRNLKLYYGRDGLDGYWDAQEATDATMTVWRGEEDITQAVFGISSWSPTLAYKGDDPADTRNKIQIRTGSIKDYLIPGESSAFYVETTDMPTEANYENNQGLGKIIVTVEGYARP